MFEFLSIFSNSDEFFTYKFVIFSLKYSACPIVVFEKLSFTKFGTFYQNLTKFSKNILSLINCLDYCRGHSDAFSNVELQLTFKTPTG